MSIRNLGILAHIDAGKTSLTEQLLHLAGVIDAPGRVDHGDTHTDSLPLEQRRGITIKSAVASFALGDVTVNLIDTPGHPDFIAEVERVLGVLDGAVLVVSAVEGVQAQTRILMRTLRRLGIPTLIFVNKIDRRGARPREVLREMSAKLADSVVAMGTAHRLGRPDAGFTPFDGTDPDFVYRLADILSVDDDALLESYVSDTLTADQAGEALLRATADCRAHPVFCGSAITGAGMDPLIDAIKSLLPPAPEDETGTGSATVFKVDRGRAGEKIAYARLHSGTIRTRHAVRLGSVDRKVTGIEVFAGGTTERRDHVTAGQIAKLWGLDEVRVGDSLGIAAQSRRRFFSPPSLETVVVPESEDRRGRLYAALGQLAEQDPLIAVRQDDARAEISVSLYGEVQKEIIAATLAERYGLEVSFRATTTLCVERPAGSGAAVETLEQPGNPFLATVGLRVEPAELGSGVDFRLGVEPGAMPSAFFRAVEETVRTTLRQGIYGWDVPDCVVTMTHSGYYARQGRRGQAFDPTISSSASDFRGLTPLVLMDALRSATTRVCEPVHHFVLEVPADTQAAVLPLLANLGGVATRQRIAGEVCELDGDIPAARIHQLRRRLPGMTRGEGVLESTFDRHEPVRAAPPRRDRTDADPLHREAYLLRLAHRV